MSTTASPGPIILTNNKSGEITLWVTFVIFFLSPLFFILVGLQVHTRKRSFHYINATIAIISALNYYKMASGGGWKLVSQGDKLVNGEVHEIFRQVYYEHYVNWSMCTPLTIFQTAILSGMSWKDVAIFVLATEGLIQTGWVGALEENVTNKFVWWGFSILFLIWVVYSMLWIGGQAVKLQHYRVNWLYIVVVGGGAALMIAYPVLFLLGEGFGVVSVGTEQIIYSILDILARVPLGFLLIYVNEFTGDNFHLDLLPESLT
ncbi:family A G protein-coupled receptor-like protein, partial [Sistotremastrum niveocremeum HHB9708]